MIAWLPQPSMMFIFSGRSGYQRFIVNCSITHRWMLVKNCREEMSSSKNKTHSKAIYSNRFVTRGLSILALALSLFLSPTVFAAAESGLLTFRRFFIPPPCTPGHHQKFPWFPNTIYFNNRYFCWERIIFFIPHHNSTMIAVGKYITRWIGIYEVSLKDDIGWIWDLNIRTVIIVHDVIFQDDLVCLKGREALSPVFPDDIMVNGCILHMYAPRLDRLTNNLVHRIHSRVNSARFGYFVWSIIFRGLIRMPFSLQWWTYILSTMSWFPYI